MLILLFYYSYYFYSILLFLYYIVNQLIKELNSIDNVSPNKLKKEITTHISCIWGLTT